MAITTAYEVLRTVSRKVHWHSEGEFREVMEAIDDLEGVPHGIKDHPGQVSVTYQAATDPALEARLAASEATQNAILDYLRRLAGDAPAPAPAPAAPLAFDPAWERDESGEWAWNGSAWVEVPDAYLPAALSDDELLFGGGIAAVPDDPFRTATPDKAVVDPNLPPPVTAVPFVPGDPQHALPPQSVEEPAVSVKPATPPNPPRAGRTSSAPEVAPPADDSKTPAPKKAPAAKKAPADKR